MRSAEGVADKMIALASGFDVHDVDLAAGAYVWGEVMLQAIFTEVRRSGFAGRVVFGGPQVSYAGATLETLYPQADAFIRGYGENAPLAFVSQAAPAPIVGVHIAGTADKCAQAAVNLEALPSPWLDGTIPLEGQRFVRWETQRGCPYRCAFCQHKEAGSRLRRRRLDGTRIGKEIERFCEAGVEDIAVLDPTFNLGQHAVDVLADFAERRFKGRLSFQCRAECADDAFLEVASSLNVRLEFGLQTIHAVEGRAVQRQNKMELVDKTLANVRRLGLNHEVSLIFGLPEQTLTSFLTSVRWCLEREVPTIRAFPLLLLRGTALDAERDRWGLVSQGGPMSMVIQSKTFTHPEWEQMSRLSEALRLTEGRHPRTVEELLALAGDLAPDFGMWQAPVE